jgi:hypothetical protein
VSHGVDPTVSVMLHHAVSDADDLRELGRLLELSRASADRRLARMAELVGAVA